MVNLYTPPQTQQAPPPAYPSLSPERLQQLIQLESLLTQTGQTQQSQPTYQPQVQTSRVGTASGTSGGAMTSIDPSVLMAQYYAMQSQNLPTQATIGLPQPQYQSQHQSQYQTQYQSQLTDVQLYAISQYIEASQVAANAASRYINFLESAIAEYFKLAEFSRDQDELINRFLYDREFALKYIRGAWIQQPFDEQFSANLAATYLEFDALMPYKQSSQQLSRNPEFTGSPVNFNARIDFNNGNPQTVNIPPLPTSNGNGGNTAITPEQYYQAIQNGQVAQAKAAALADPSLLFASIFAG